MSSNVYDFTLAAAVGATQRIDVMGSKALLRVASGGEVEIRTDTGKIYRCNEGQGLDMGLETFNFLTLRNLQAVANSGLLSIGDSGWIDNRITGSVAIIDSIGVGCQTQGVAFNAITVFQATAIILPGSNLNGAILRGYAIELQSGAGGNSDCMLIAAPTAPVAAGGAQLATLARLVDTVSVRVFLNQWSLQKKIPAGWGLYHVAINSTAAAVASGARVSFELL